MRKSINSSIIVVLLFLFACQSNEYDETLIHGKWKAVKWTVEGEKEGRNASLINFDFHSDQTYLANYGQQTEKGSYYINGDKLYTTEEGKAQKNVQITKLTSDSLVFLMNRVGTLETLTLVK